ncbi:CMRF35-like molecule 3 [Astatotilapia calliptera]|uniref:CMRF35-like molecule 3 n=1 Tax=Astatotilapia calliptera TaxID=8154 RepID=UPI000E3F9907|nr:CMRF35-like molecule 3 [Astatotilapia calliptera]
MFLLFIVLKGDHSLTTVSQVSVKAGESISIPCLYDSQYENYLKYLCKGYYYRECTYAVKTNQPGHFYVVHQDITGFNGGNITIKFYSTQTGKIKWCKLGSECVTQPTGSIDGTRVSINESAHNVFTVTMSRVTTKSSGWYLCYKGDLQVPVHLTVNETFTPSKYNNSEPEICLYEYSTCIMIINALM